MSIIPKKLKVGDQIRVISPSSSIDRVGGFEDNLIAKVRLEAMVFMSLLDNIYTIMMNFTPVVLMLV